MISGIANSPIPDRENELISSGAMEAAIPAFMKIPILHLDHTERPVGYITECRIVKAGDPLLSPDFEKFDMRVSEGDTYFEASIPHDGDCDDVWEKIEKGVYNKISIYGVRTNASTECKLQPHQRVSPCVTKAIRLWSFSLVGENAINPKSYIKVAKSFSEDLCAEFEEKTTELIKAAFPDYSMAPDSDQTVQDAIVTEPSTVVVKAEVDSVVQDVTILKGDMAELKTGITGILDYLKKSDSPAVEAPVETGEYITKAALESTLDLIVKAKVELAVSEVKKAYDIKFAEFEQQMKDFGSETIKKGGATVVLDMAGNKVAEYGNSFLSNLDALGDE